LGGCKSIITKNGKVINMYKVIFSRSAEKELIKLPTIVVKRIAPFIDSLSENPRSTGSKKLKGTK